MSRFYENEDGLPWEMWEQVVSRALGGQRGQKALAELEAALLALPEPKLVEGHLATSGGVCAVGAVVAHHRAQREGTDIQAAIDVMATDADDWEGMHETVDAGTNEGLPYSVAWHFAYLNDEQFYSASPERRYELMLAWVRRALGREEVAA